MRLSEVQVGGVYDTKVSGAWVKVRVVSQVEYLRPNHVMGEKVRRADDGTGPHDTGRVVVEMAVLR